MKYESKNFIKIVLDETNKIKSLGGVSFSEVIKEITKKKIFPATSSYIKTKINILEKCFDKVVENSKTSPIVVKRVNELGNALEPILKNQINITKLKCDMPKTASGKKQSSGYPDLIIEDGSKSIYIEVKTYDKNNENSLTSSFRSFYFEPKKETSKVNKDGYHLLIAFGHIGKDKDNVGYVLDDWHLVDLSKLKVFFKGEFQSNNKNMYAKNNIIAKMKS